MKQFITFNITIYLTKYFLANPLFKLFFIFCLTYVIKDTLDISSYAVCMEETNQLEPRPTRIRFDASIEIDETQHYRTQLMKSKYTITRQLKTLHEQAEEIQGLTQKNSELINSIIYSEATIEALKRNVRILKQSLIEERETTNKLLESLRLKEVISDPIQNKRKLLTLFKRK